MRAGEELDLASLSNFLNESVTVEQFPSGHSNLTYLVRAAEREYVLRRPPLGPVAPKAHDMAREYAVLAAVGPHFPEAPRVYRLCEDSSVLGAPFFLMERRKGFVIRDSVPVELASVSEYGRRISEAFLDCMVRLHAIDINATGLISLGKPDGFLHRQVAGWADRWNRAKTTEVPEIECVIQWLITHMPAASAPALIHNDYKLDNVMLESVGKVSGVLDWEMATVGDPLADLGLTLCYWCWADAPGMSSQREWYSREQFIERYAASTGRDVSRVAWYEVLGIFKLAVIIQQIYARYQCGQTRDERFRDFDARVAALARTAANVILRHQWTTATFATRSQAT
jgi:aminoglycoside phosphotransferase (APT) family kinase protein